MHPTDISFPNLREIVPAGAEACAVALRPADSNHIDARFPGVRIPERLTSAVATRRLHYAAGRYCARKAMAQLGLVSDEQLPRDANNVPVWPAGIVGSIAHTSGVAWAAVSRSDGMRGIGIDVEEILEPQRAARLERLICSPNELALAADRALTRAEFLTLAFSLKESLYKCVFPLVRRFFGFHAATVLDVDVVRCSVRARLETTLTEAFPAGILFSGRFVFSDRHVFTSVFLPRVECGLSASDGAAAASCPNPPEEAEAGTTPAFALAQPGRAPARPRRSFLPESPQEAEAGTTDHGLRTTDHGPRTTGLTHEHPYLS